MARYIDADKLKEAIKDLPEQERIAYMGIYDVINFQPTADVQEVKHGKWLIETEPDGSPRCFHCSVCDDAFQNINITSAYVFCPNCGAKMDKE